MLPACSLQRFYRFGVTDSNSWIPAQDRQQTHSNITAATSLQSDSHTLYISSLSHGSILRWRQHHVTLLVLAGRGSAASWTPQQGSMSVNM